MIYYNIVKNNTKYRGGKMGKIKSVEELKRFRKQLKEKTAEKKAETKTTIVIGAGTASIAAGVRKIFKTIMEELEKRNIRDVQVVERGSLGFEGEEPVVGVERGRKTVFYGKVTPEMAKEIVRQHVIGGEVASPWVISIRKKRD